MSEGLAEVTATLERLQAEIEDLAVGGLRAAGPDRLRVLEAMREDLVQVGAGHLAGRLEDLVQAIRQGDRAAAPALMRTQASLRVFERLLTREVAARRLAVLAGAGEERQDAADAAGGDQA